MSRSDDQFLAHLQQRSLRQQEKFLSNLSSRLNRSPHDPPPRHLNEGAPSFWRSYRLSLPERIEQFQNNWSAVGGHVAHVQNVEEARNFILDLGASLQAKRWICQDVPLLTKMNLLQSMENEHISWSWWNEGNDDRLQQAAEAEIGIVVAEHAVSSTGSVVVYSGGKKGRAVSLLPAVVVLLVKTADIKTTLGEVMEEIRRIDSEHMPAGIHFISGPSRSADIENDLTIGVHGPGVVYAILIDEV